MNTPIFRMQYGQLKTILKALYPYINKRNESTSAIKITTDARSHRLFFETLKTFDVGIRFTIDAIVNVDTILYISLPVINSLLEMILSPEDELRFNETEIDNDYSIFIPINENKQLYASKYEENTTYFHQNFIDRYRFTGKQVLDELFNIRYATGDDPVRMVFNSILIREDKVVASDTYRLAVRNFPHTVDRDLLIPKEAFFILEKTLSKRSTVFFGYNSKYIFFDFRHKNLDADVKIYVINRNYDYGKYPDFEKVIPQNNLDSFHIENVETFVKTIDENKDSTTKAVKLEFLNNGKLKISGHELKYERILGSIASFEPFTIHLNAKFLKNIIRKNNIKNLVIQKDSNSDRSPVIIKDSNKPENIDLVLPIRKEG